MAGFVRPIAFLPMSGPECPTSKRPPTHPDGEIEMSKTLRMLPALALPFAAAVAAPAAMAAPLTLAVAVDTTVCESVPVQCSLAGHTFAAASSTNHNPIALRLTVVNKGGLPVNGLTAANFNFSNGIVPAGGGSATECSVADCGASTFAAAGNGLYQIYLDRAAAGNWKAGKYAGTIAVTAGANSGTTLVTFTIPN